MGRRFFRKLFWAGSPKAGMLFSITLMTILLFVVLPLTLYIKFVAQPTVLWLFFMETRLPSMKLLLLGFVGLLIVYSLILQLRYYLSLLRDVLGLRKRVAVPLGILAALVPGVGILGVILPGAIKTRNRKAMGAMVATILFSVALGVAEVFSGVWPVLLLFFVLAIFFWVRLIYHFPETPRVGLWGYSPVMILLAFIAVMGIQDLVLDHQIDELSRDFEEQSRIPLTSEEVINEIFDGVSIHEVEVLDSLGDHKLPGLYSIKSVLDFTRPSDEEFTQFDTFMATNAVRLAKVDAFTAKRDFDVAYSGNRAALVAGMGWDLAVANYMDWTSIYSAKAHFAAWRGDTATVLDSLIRLDNISTYLGITADDRRMVTRIDKERFASLCYALTVIPDDFAEKLQAEIHAPAKTVDELIRIEVKSEYFLSEDSLQGIRNKLWSSGAGSSQVTLAIPLGRVGLKYANRCALRGCINFFEILNDASLTDTQRYAKLEADFCRDENQNLRLPLCYNLSVRLRSFQRSAFFVDQRQTAVAGLAVERYRRCHGKLPEALSDLVPEFLDAVPNSCRDGKPLDYQTGEIEVQRPNDELVVIHGFRISGREILSHGPSKLREIPFFVAAVPVPGEDERTHPSTLFPVP